MKNKEELNGNKLDENINKKKESKNGIDEITIVYDFNKSKEMKIDEEYINKFKGLLKETISREKLFGERFVENNKNICKIIINDKEEELCSYLQNYKNYLKDGKLEVKLIGIKNIIDFSSMFSGCMSLYSLQELSKLNENNIINIEDIFFYCSSLSFIDDISRWKINKVKSICGVFQYCSSLNSLPDISKWNTDNVNNMNSIFEKCLI